MDVRAGVLCWDFKHDWIWFLFENDPKNVWGGKTFWGFHLGKFIVESILLKNFNASNFPY